MDCESGFGIGHVVNGVFSTLNVASNFSVLSCASRKPISVFVFMVLLQVCSPISGSSNHRNKFKVNK